MKYRVICNSVSKQTIWIAKNGNMFACVVTDIHDKAITLQKTLTKSAYFFICVFGFHYTVVEGVFFVTTPIIVLVVILDAYTYMCEKLMLTRCWNLQ